MNEVWVFLGTSLATNIINFAEVLVIVFGFGFTISSIKNSRDSRNIDFVLHAEGQIDPLFLSLSEQDPITIKTMHPNLIPPDYPEEKVKAFILTYYAYRHASRMYYLFAKSEISLGMSEADRKRMADEWMNELAKYNIDIIAEIHRFSHESDEFNAGFIEFVDRFLEVSRPAPPLAPNQTKVSSTPVP